MQNALAQRASNILKTGILMLGFSVLVIAVGYALASYLGNGSILYVAVAISLITTGISYFFSDRIALRASGAKPVTKAEQPELYAIMERLTAAAKVPMPRLYLIDEPQINAFATGRNPRHAAVAVTAGALQKLSPAELEGVLGHELAHVVNRDILVSSIAVVLAGSVAMASQMLGNMMLFGGGGDREDRSPASGILSLLLILLAPVAAMLMQMAVSRRRESLADASGSLLTGKPLDLASALGKIGADAAPLRTANDATAHLWIANPFKGRAALGFVHKLFMTHPPLEERVAALQAMAERQ